MKMRKRNDENSGLDMNHIFDNGSGTAVVPGSQSTDIKQTGSSRPADKKGRSSLARRGGPRTRAGKERTKRNALRHGIFSDVVVLAGESRRDYMSLLKGLRDTLRPEGTFEELLVEKMAVTVWRIRHLLVAEGAEIRHNMESFMARSRQRELREMLEVETKSPLPSNKGLIGEIHNSYALDVCLLILDQLRRGIEGAGFDQERDLALLEKIYGIRDEAQPKEDFTSLIFSGREPPLTKSASAKAMHHWRNVKSKSCLKLTARFAASNATRRRALRWRPRKLNWKCAAAAFPKLRHLIACFDTRLAWSDHLTGRLANSSVSSACVPASRYRQSSNFAYLVRRC
jgi:hypothetical protein